MAHTCKAGDLIYDQKTAQHVCVVCGLCPCRDTDIAFMQVQSATHVRTSGGDPSNPLDVISAHAGMETVIVTDGNAWLDSEKKRFLSKRAQPVDTGDSDDGDDAMGQGIDDADREELKGGPLEFFYTDHNGKLVMRTSEEARAARDAANRAVEAELAAKRRAFALATSQRLLDPSGADVTLAPAGESVQDVSSSFSFSSLAQSVSQQHRDKKQQKKKKKTTKKNSKLDRLRRRGEKRKRKAASSPVPPPPPLSSSSSFPSDDAPPAKKRRRLSDAPAVINTTLARISNKRNRAHELFEAARKEATHLCEKANVAEVVKKEFLSVWARLVSKRFAAFEKQKQLQEEAQRHALLHPKEAKRVKGKRVVYDWPTVACIVLHLTAEQCDVWTDCSKLIEEHAGKSFKASTLAAKVSSMRQELGFEEPDVLRKVVLCGVKTCNALSCDLLIDEFKQTARLVCSKLAITASEHKEVAAGIILFLSAVRRKLTEITYTRLATQLDITGRRIQKQLAVLMAVLPAS